MVEKENLYDRMTTGRKREVLDKLNEHRVTPEILRRLKDHMICGKCAKPIDDIEVHHFQWQRKYDFYAKCHGDVEKSSMTEWEFVDVMHNDFTCNVFKPKPVPIIKETLLLENKL